jgi:hypothetical protein
VYTTTPSLLVEMGSSDLILPRSWNYRMNHYAQTISSVSFFGNTGVWTQGFALPSQVLYSSSHLKPSLVSWNNHHEIQVPSLYYLNTHLKKIL